MTEHEDITFTCMGCEMRLLAEGEGASGAVAAARRLLAEVDRRLSRFRPESELSRLNVNPEPVVAASPLLCGAVHAATWAARRSGGLVDPMTAAHRAAGRAAAGRRAGAAASASAIGKGELCARESR